MTKDKRARSTIRFTAEISKEIKKDAKLCGLSMNAFMQQHWYDYYFGKNGIRKKESENQIA